MTAFHAKKLANRLAETGPKRLWEAQVGIGFYRWLWRKDVCIRWGTKKADTLYCLDAKTGRKQWSYSWLSNIGAKFYIGGPGSTPTVTDGRVYVSGKWGEVSCLVPHPKTLAKVSALGAASRQGGSVRPTWGFNGSPLVLGDRLLAQCRFGRRGIGFENRQDAGNPPAVKPATPRSCMLGGQPHVIVSSGRAYSAVKAGRWPEAWSLRWFTVR